MPRRPNILFLAICVWVVLLVMSIVGAWRVYQVISQSRAQLTELRVSLGRASEGPTTSQPDAASEIPPDLPASPAAARDAFMALCAESAELAEALGPLADASAVTGPAALVVAHLPRVGDRAAGMLALASATSDALSAAGLVCDAVRPVLQLEDGKLDLTAVVALLGESRDDLRTAAEKMRSAQAHLATIDTRTLNDRTYPLYAALQKRLPRAVPALALLAELPGLLGYDGPRTYLVLGQNTDELRPTGGFIGTAGVLRFEHGALVRSQYGTSFTFDLPPSLRVSPPMPLQRYMDGRFAGGAYWQLREANWWPDFPSSARQARYFFEQREASPVSGVIAVDQDVIAALLTVTGPVRVPEYDEVVTAETARARMDYYTHEVGAPDEMSRKAFVSALYTALLDRLLTLPRQQYFDLARAVDRAFNEQHVQIWSGDEAVQSHVGALGWDGRLLETNGDYLYPVSANLSANKINRDVEQDLHYVVQPRDDGRLEGSVRLRVRNRRPSDDPGPYRTAEYRDFLRLYVPPGSELISADGFASDVEAASECGRTMIAGLVVVAPRSQAQIEVRYRLPATVTLSGYNFLVQKQPGVPPFPVTVGIESHGLGETTASLTGHRLFQPLQGRIISWIRPLSQPASAAPACVVHTEPPLALRPPARIEIAALALEADVVDIGVEPSGRMESPPTGDVVGWYRQAARPGQAGNMVVSGHVDWEKRPAVFWKLHEATPGTPIRVVDDLGTTHTYEVQWSRSINARSTNLNELIGPTTHTWLTLITCSGRFDPTVQEYTERLIVRARLVSGG